MNREPAVEILPDRVVKTNRPSLLAVEAEKTRRAHELGQATGLFRVPRVLSFDPEAGRLELERLPAIWSLREALHATSEWQRLLSQVGCGLAVIHDQLELPASLARPLPDVWQLDGSAQVVLHGDLTVQNVQVDRHNGCPVILDWSNAPVLGLEGTLGPREFDLAWFVRSLFFVRRRGGLLSRRPRREAEIVLANYFGHTGHSAPADRFVGYLREVGARFRTVVLSRNEKPLLRRLDYLLHAYRYERWVRSEGFRARCEAIL